MTKVTIQELLDEIHQQPDAEYEIDSYIFPLFNRMLNERGFQCHITTPANSETFRCRIEKMAKP